ncbi:hypothetical protein Golob_013230, partial [Gossypium lobatum]|nr:hypothetical protein [Gossypium lobatum]
MATFKSKKNNQRLENTPSFPFPFILSVERFLSDGVPTTPGEDAAPISRERKEVLILCCTLGVFIGWTVPLVGGMRHADRWSLSDYRTVQDGGSLTSVSLVGSHVATGPCASYMLRKRALYGDMSRYTCCAGYMPCSGRCGESKCPEFCLCTEVGEEVFLCFGNSVASTRFLLQDEFNIQTTKCDNCIIGFMFCLQQIACIFSLVAMIVGSDEIQEASQILSCLADMVYC